ncbi:acetyl-CoA C-acyltransferase [Bacillus pseudomycoides]|uniref:acetyl-CoA C-acetyltransferase n=1 Tax=Bacillus pseudomycoides TaxID=64104 RepID=A0AA91VCV9_9BACI|nr:MULTISPECIES: acetyl-CoA C-acetyltransferase [Bacillus]PEB51867.1 acetyl-CoA C-acyltransferase [Bacillus sp. AFS098217]PED81845.1 acetyl-CoA C-acyltransferase [Bacillus pseudomycoides]PEU15273.1 acetyl-CoA C-acyltransferase [Bacillus sp. AFS014408]PEU17876.1 acetyl-CoA C-acyltransferase [Bacillus sp. AFS019443]PFW63326.1 acetyl-CoA C-acyltransferase [Bacillus sp. AFS075034]
MATYIVDGARTAFGTFGGGLKDVTDIDLGVAATEEALKRSGIQASNVDEIIFGNIIHTSSSSAYLARHIGLKSGMAESSSALTLNRLCGSGMQSIVSAAQSIASGDAKVVVAGGTENMSLSPHVLRGTRFGTPNKAPKVDDMLWETLTDNYVGCGMGMTAENLAEKYSISREEQDQFSVESQEKAIAARDSGRFAEEIVPVKLKGRKGKEVIFDTDEYIREGASVEGLAKLKPAFKKDGTVTPGNASGINDGAAAVLVASEEYVSEHNLKPLAKIVTWGVAGVDPSIMGIGPVPASKKALEKAGLSLDDIGLFEFNEAFASQSIAVIKELGVDKEKVNVNGGAVALGHPVGASGARITYSLALEMRRRNVKYGLASLCIGGGQGIAIILENVQS